MDRFVQNLLSDWGLSRFIETFEVAGIDEEVFDDIDEKMLGRLFASHECGFERKFVKRYEDWKKNKAKSQDAASNVNANQSAQEPRNPINDHHSNELSPQSVNNNVTTVHESNASDASSNPATVLPVVITQKKTVAQLLDSTIRGRIVFHGFLKHKILDTRLLSDLVLEYEMEVTGSYSIKPSRLEEIADECFHMFKRDDNDITKALFFFQCVKENEGRKCTIAGGVMLDKCSYIRKKLTKAGVISDDEDECIEAEQLTETPNGMCHERRIKLLNKGEGTEDDIKDEWDKTFSIRLRCDDAIKYMGSYNCLLLDFALDMLKQDFDKVYSEEKSKLKDSWDPVCNIIVAYSLNKYKKYKFSPWDEELIESGNHKSLGFFCLCKCLGGSYQIKAGLKRKSDGKDPFQDDRDLLTKNSFILSVKTEAEFESFKSKKRDWETFWQNLEPYVAVVGKEWKTVTVYVVIHEKSYKITSKSILEAVDTLFKCMKVLNIAPPSPCAKLWAFIQEFFYLIPLQRPQYRTVGKFISNLKKPSSGSEVTAEVVEDEEETIDDLE